MKSFLTILLLLLAIGIVACNVFYMGLKQTIIVPKWLLIVGLLYIFLQLMRIRIIKSAGKRTDWLYYVGLIMMAFPVFLDYPEQLLPYRWILIFLISSMIIPALQDVLNQQKEQEI